ncbi:hypothetical protein L249_3490 [Ophiocordyceps polyrhachis-furcata BCC 54312]|uniref:NTF2 domain-containing protein n=1 Tax=Ophiocordyceps polyrhachis-furcata BCC 54312 TaxID=1330021 RepID=A0A367LMD6_9HYPO|nr:hypothetical protein L249_3490 [Ophiocordyceps polyrhachis-furcata BCC 54312]
MAAAAATYKQFLAAPSTSLLADQATLHYVTTTTTFTGATDIVKHLSALQRQVQKKKQAVLSTIDGGHVVALEVDTDLEFLTSGGVYLPGLDDNFLSDRTASLPIMHIVTLDGDGKILQIRQQWDQGSLLKQLEIIGKTGRNWPIKDGREQLSMIQNCLQSVGLVAPASPGHNDVVVRARGSSANALRDPHASLELFAPRELIESAKPSSVVSPYAGSRPRQRDFSEILGDEPEADDEHRNRSASPTKGGQGKNFHPVRIFEGQEYTEEEVDETSPSGTSNRRSLIRPDPRKYNHFDFADGSDQQHQPKPSAARDRPKSKHDSQWSFDDFVTPQRPKPSKSYRRPDARNWDPEPNNEETEKPAGKTRRDAEKHFELQDDGPRVPRQERPGAKPRGATHNEGLGLYKDNLVDSENASPSPKRALGNITNFKDRTKDFDPHFAMTDDSPETRRPQQMPEGRMKAVKMMDANWAAYDQSPAAQKENQPQPGQVKDNRINIAGDGMGARKTNGRGEARTGDKEGIHIAGDGMGGKKGTNRNWLYGDDEADEAPKAPASRRGNASAAQKSFYGH